MRHNNIRSERVRIGFSARDLAQAIGVSTASVANWEKFSSEPSAKNLVKLARLFKCTPDYLIDLVDQRNGTASIDGVQPSVESENATAAAR